MAAPDCSWGRSIDLFWHKVLKMVARKEEKGKVEESNQQEKTDTDLTSVTQTLILAMFRVLLRNSGSFRCVAL